MAPLPRPHHPSHPCQEGLAVLGAPFAGDIHPVTTQQLGLGVQGPGESGDAGGRAGCHGVVPRRGATAWCHRCSHHQPAELSRGSRRWLQRVLGSRGQHFPRLCHDPSVRRKMPPPLPPFPRRRASRCQCRCPHPQEADRKHRAGGASEGEEGTVWWGMGGAQRGPVRTPWRHLEPLRR